MNNYQVALSGDLNPTWVSVLAKTPSDAAASFADSQYYSGNVQPEYEVDVKLGSQTWSVHVDVNVEFDAWLIASA